MQKKIFKIFYMQKVENSENFLYAKNKKIGTFFICKKKRYINYILKFLL